MGINTFFINKILKSVPFEIRCTDKKIDFQGTRVKGLEVSAPIIGYLRFWQLVPQYSGNMQWIVSDLSATDSQSEYSSPKVRSDDPIQKIAIAILVDIQGFASERCLAGDVSEASPEFAVAIAMNKFLLEVVPSALQGPYAQELIRYALSETQMIHHSFWSRLEASLSEETIAIPVDSGNIGFGHEAEILLPQERVNETKNPVLELSKSMSSELLDFRINYAEFLPEVDNEAVVIQLFKNEGRNSNSVEFFYIRDGLWRHARGTEELNSFKIIEETVTGFRAVEFREFALEAHVILANRFIDSLYGRDNQVVPDSRFTALNRFNELLASMRIKSEWLLASDDTLGAKYEDAYNAINANLPTEYFRENWG